MKLFDNSHIRDNFEWSVTLPDMVSDEETICNIYYLADGFCLGCYGKRDFLMISKTMEQLTLDDIITMFNYLGVEYFQDEKTQEVKTITVYETNLNFAKFDKWLN